MRFTNIPILIEHSTHYKKIERLLSVSQVRSGIQTIPNFHRYTQGGYHLIDRVDVEGTNLKHIYDIRRQFLDSSQNNALSFPEKDQKEARTDESISEGNNDQSRLRRKSGGSEIDKFANLPESISDRLKREVTLIKSRSLLNCRTASILDICHDKPDYQEVQDQLKLRARTTTKSLISIMSFFDSEKCLYHEFNCIWEVVIDLYRTIILFGFSININKIRSEMLKTWLYLGYLTLSISDEKSLELTGTIEIGDIVIDRADKRPYVFKISRWMKVIKYKLAAFAAWAKSSDVMPKSPFEIPDQPWMLINRKFKTFLLMHRTYSKDKGIWYMSLVDSLCRGVKKGAARASDSDCHVSNWETFKLFTEQRESQPYVYREKETNVNKEISVTDMLQEIDRSVDEIIGDMNFEPRFSHCPSFSSSVESSLQTGGHLRPVREAVGYTERFITVNKKSGMVFSPLLEKYGNNTNEVDPDCSQPIELTTEEQEDLAIRNIGSLKSIDYIEITTNPTGAGTDIDWESMAELQMRKGNPVTNLVALKESLKIRGISTPSAVETWLLKPLQQFLSKALLQHDVFAVTGTPLTAEHLNRCFTHLLPYQNFVSGDYDNATNNMILAYTRRCIERICFKLNLPPFYAQLAIASLCDNKIQGTIPIGKSDKGKTVKLSFADDQQAAQPMGKVLSFTVLCIINFTVCRKAIELDRGTSVEISKFPGLINGDDCCFPIQDFNHWVGCSRMVGLYNSIGKTFTSRNFVEMNSRTFLMRGDEQLQVSHDGQGKMKSGFFSNISFEEVPFINFGLMKGLIRSASNEKMRKKDEDKLAAQYCETAEAVTRMGWCHFQLTTGFEFIHLELDHMFKYYHNKYLLSPFLNGIPYYIPQWLGGLGLNPGGFHKQLISDEQRKAARWVYQHHDQLKTVTIDKTCHLHEIFNKYIKHCMKRLGIQPIDNWELLETEHGDVYNLKEENQKVYGEIIEQVWRNARFDEIFTIMDNEFFRDSGYNAAKRIRNNSSLWRQAFNITKKDDTYQVLPWYKIWQQKQNEILPIVSLNHVAQQEWLVNTLANVDIKRKISPDAQLHVRGDMYKPWTDCQ